MLDDNDRCRAESPFKVTVRCGDLLKTSRIGERNAKVRALKGARVCAGISEPRYPFR